LTREGGRSLDIEDEVEVAEKEKVEKEVIEASKDMEFDDFKEKYIEHIEGRAENVRDRGDVSAEEDDVVANPSPKDK